MSSPDDTALHLAWQPELADFTEAFRARNRARRAWLKIWVLATVLLVVGLVVSIAGTDRSLAYACYVGAVMFPLLALIIQPVSVRRFWRRNPALHSPLRARVDRAAGISLAGQSSGTHPWPVVHSFLETDRVFVVQLSGYRNLAILLLAKRGLPHEQDVDQLRDLLSAGIAESARV